MRRSAFDAAFSESSSGEGGVRQEGACVDHFNVRRRLRRVAFDCFVQTLRAAEARLRKVLIMKNASTFLLAGAAGALTAGSAIAQDAAVFPGDWLLDIRARYQTGEQTGKLDAESLTVRTRFGVDIPFANDRFRFLIEGENNFSIIEDERNTSLKPKSEYATINDADFTELNRLQLTFDPDGPFSVIAGRQYLGDDDGRFIGSPGWGQDKNSHDAVRFDFAEGVFSAAYAYHWQVNRGPGEDFDWQTDSHLFRAVLAPSDALEVSAFAYLIDITETGRENRSNSTWGGRAIGSTPLNGFELSYDVMFANQTDYGSATAEFDNNLYAAELGLARDGARLTVGYDVLEGDGSTSIVNPLGANHGFHGWADVFSGGGRAAPPDGLEDFHVHARYARRADLSFLQGWSVDLIWRDFEAQNIDADLGEEWDGRLTLNFTDAVGLGIKFADYDGPDTPVAPADRRKTWVYLTYRH